MSVEFSGQSRKSGTGVRPSRACAISATLSERWLLVTVRARPSASIPRPGTLPWTTPTVTVPSRPASGSTWNERSPTPATPTAASTSTAGSARGQTRGRRSRTSRTTQATPCPTSATRKLTPATPTSGNQPFSGVSTAAYASRVQPKPPKGTDEYASSTATQQAAAGSGHQRSRVTSESASPSTPKNRAMKAISSAATHQPRTCTQEIVIASIAKPKA